MVCQVLLCYIQYHICIDDMLYSICKLLFSIYKLDEVIFSIVFINFCLVFVKVVFRYAINSTQYIMIIYVIVTSRHCNSRQTM